MMANGGKTILSEFWHRLVGIRGATQIFPDQIRLPSSSSSTTTTTTSTKNPPSSSSSNFGHVYPSPAAKEIGKHRLVFFGEIHSMPPIIAFQRQVQASMIQDLSNQQRRQQEQLQEQLQEQPQQTKDAKVHVIMEHFSFELQDLLDEYCNGKWTFEELVQKYHELGEEGHDLYPYEGLLEDAKEHGVRLHAGFLPRKYARMLLKEGPDRTIQAASAWLPVFGNLRGTSFHYNVFESLLTGRSIYDVDQTSQPTDQFRRIFDAQVLKDVSMAHRVNTLLKEHPNKEDKFLVIAGNGHLLHYCGVPERVYAEHPDIVTQDSSCLVISESIEQGSILEKEEKEGNLSEILKEQFGPEGSNPADYVFLYEIPQEILDKWQHPHDGNNNNNNESHTNAKEETQKAYDRVGESANLQGNTAKAAWIMYHMGYTEEQFEIAGSDAYNFQGVGNPHLHAQISPGDRVLDVGSGLGIDSFIACHATGPTGQVIGIDISSKEVKHAQQRAEERGLSSNLYFHKADMEKIPLPENSIDVIISNGAFCLAPNKQKAFEELFRVLKPGGRISVCTTTTQVDQLEVGVTWPLCMQMFIAKKELYPMCQNIGFINITIDDSDSRMTMEIPEEVLNNETNNPNRNKIHVGGEDFQHLENYDMDRICARVCIVAEKPPIT